MIKTIPLLVTLASLAPALTLPAFAQLVLAPVPPPSASGAITETQFDALVAAVPSLVAGKTAADVASVSLYGTNLNVRFATVNSANVTEQVTLTSAQVAAFFAAGPALPSGKTTAQVRAYTATRTPTGGRINLFVTFSS